MKLHYDQKSYAVYIRLNDKRYVESNEISEGIIFDYDSKGKIIGIEILDASKKFPKGFSHDFIQEKVLVSAA